MSSITLTTTEHINTIILWLLLTFMIVQAAIWIPPKICINGLHTCFSRFCLGCWDLPQAKYSMRNRYMSHSVYWNMFFPSKIRIFPLFKVSFFFSLIVELLTAYNQNIWIYRAFPAVSHLQPCKIKTLILFFLLFLKMMPAPTLSCLWVEQFSDLELWIGQNHINWQLSLCHI